MPPTATRVLIYFACSLLAGLVAITGESLWIDEGQTLLFAQQPTFQAWLNELLNSRKSEAQMPLGMLVAWVGGKLLGLGEWQLRAPNLLWLGLAGVAVGLVGRKLKQPALLPLFLLHPFLWFYLNEARPYALQICAGAWLLLVLVRVQSDHTLGQSDLWIFGAAAFVGFGSSLLFAFALLGVAAGAFLIYRRQKIVFATSLFIPLGVTLAGLGALGVYYLYTLSRGATGAKLWTVSPVNLAFSIYDLLGFSGLGPPRNELRQLVRHPAELARHFLAPGMLFGLGLATVLYAIITVRLWKLRREMIVVSTAATAFVASVALYGAATVVHFPFWGRHLAALLPWFTLLAIIGASPPTSSAAPIRRCLVLIPLMVCLTISSLFLRFGHAYRKDDYRSASRLALKVLAAGKVVIWSADPEECARYYGVVPEKAAASGARLIFTYPPPTASEVASWPAPDLICQSKPDIYDPQGYVTRLAQERQYRVVRRLPSFVVWAKEDAIARLLE